MEEPAEEGHWYLDFRLAEAELPLAEARLERLGGAWVVDGADPGGPGGKVAVRLLLEDKAQAVKAAALAAAAALAGEFSPEGVALGCLAARDWVAESQAALAPIRVGRLLIHGSHDRAGRLPHLLALEIEAGQAFGTGYHETTAGCLTLLQGLAKRGPLGRVLDVGTGSGILAMAAARLGARDCLGIDNDPGSVVVARRNVRGNGLGGAVRLALGRGPWAPALGPQRGYDLAVANILAGPLVAMAREIVGAVRPGGRIVLSGLLTRQRRWVLRRYLGQGCRLERDLGLGDWSTLLIRRA